MMETADPRAALQDRSVATRCAACRDLARVGTWGDMALLVDRGWNDKSMAVRLYAASAAADLAQRLRDTLDDTQRAQVVTWTFAGDPGVCPSMLMLTSTVQTGPVLSRLGRILRDPRSDVRLGVLTSLRRMALSSRADREGLARAIDPWFDDPKVPSDARVELGKIIGEAGLATLRPRLIDLRARGEGAGEVADVALDRLETRATPEAWIGAWWSDGRDVFENREVDDVFEVAVCDGQAWYGASGTREVHAGDVPKLGDDPVARIVATPLGSHDALAAIQVDGRTWWSVDDEGLAGFLDTHHDKLRGLPQAGRDVLVARGEALGGAGAERVRAATAWIAGDLDGAMEAAEAQLARKRARGDAWFWRGVARLERGDAGGLEDLEIFVGKAKKDHPLRAAAERRMA